MAAPAPQPRKDSSMAGLPGKVRGAFDAVPDTRRAASVKFTMSDTLSSALAMFSLKYGSLLQFDTEMRGDAGTVRHNLCTLFGVTQAPCDSQMRDILDSVDPARLRPAFRALHSALQRGNVLKKFAWDDDKILLSMDGTIQFASRKTSCKYCCVNKRKSGDEFYHQLLAAAIVHPDHKRALPLDFEPITLRDGNTKNDYERNAGKRLLNSIKQQYPDRQFVVLEDALAANGPHIQELLRHKMDFTIGAKPGSNAALFDEVGERLNRSECIASAPDDLNRKGFGCGFRFTNDIPLNDSHPDLRINFLEYGRLTRRASRRSLLWRRTCQSAPTTPMRLRAQGVPDGRWRTNYLTSSKTKGYNLEHSYDHGKQFLCSTLGGLMLLAVLIDEIQELACLLFQAARGAYHARIVLREKLRALFFTSDIQDWESLMRALANPGSVRMDLPDTTSG